MNNNDKIKVAIAIAAVLILSSIVGVLISHEIIKKIIEPSRPQHVPERVIHTDSIKFYPHYRIMIDSIGQCYMPVNCPEEK